MTFASEAPPSSRVQLSLLDRVSSVPWPMLMLVVILMLMIIQMLVDDPGRRADELCRQQDDLCMIWEEKSGVHASNMKGSNGSGGNGSRGNGSGHGFGRRNRGSTHQT